MPPEKVRTGLSAHSVSSTSASTSSLRRARLGLSMP